MEQQTKALKTLKFFNVTGFIHTLITLIVFAMSVVNYLYQEQVFYYTIRWLSTATLVNSLIWLISGLILIKRAKYLKNPVSIEQTRIILFTAIILVLTPDIMTAVLFYLPSLKESQLINIVCFASPAFVFAGWFIGKRLGKQINKKG